MEERITEYLILLIEDNASHAQLIEAALCIDSTHHQLIRTESSKQALNFLHQREEYADAPRPHIILLNLNLPDHEGKTILTTVKTHARLKRIPIIVLASSDSEEEILHTYDLQGNCYVIKSNDLNQLAFIVKRIKEFWLGIVTLPLE